MGKIGAGVQRTKPKLKGDRIWVFFVLVSEVPRKVPTPTHSEVILPPPVKAGVSFTPKNTVRLLFPPVLPPALFFLILVCISLGAPDNTWARVHFFLISTPRGFFGKFFYVFGTGDQ